MKTHDTKTPIGGEKPLNPRSLSDRNSLKRVPFQYYIRDIPGNNFELLNCNVTENASRHTSNHKNPTNMRLD